jgi:tripartite-type tricarboxylate transporter receptor subunit TctC
VERGEVICRAFTLTAFFAREPFHTWRKKNFVRVLMQTGTKRDKRLPDTPTIYELMDQYKSSPPERSLAKLTLASSIFGRPYVMAPGTPPELVKTLQQAFEKTMTDEEFNADATRQKLEIDPSSADELQKLAHEVMSQPPAIVKRMQALLGK